MVEAPGPEEDGGSHEHAEDYCSPHPHFPGGRGQAFGGVGQGTVLYRVKIGFAVPPRGGGSHAAGELSMEPLRPLLEVSRIGPCGRMRAADR